MASDASGTSSRFSLNRFGGFIVDLAYRGEGKAWRTGRTLAATTLALGALYLVQHYAFDMKDSDILNLSNIALLCTSTAITAMVAYQLRAMIKGAEENQWSHHKRLAALAFKLFIIAAAIYVINGLQNNAWNPLEQNKLMHDNQIAQISALGAIGLVVGYHLHGFLRKHSDGNKPSEPATPEPEDDEPFKPGSKDDEFIKPGSEEPFKSGSGDDEFFDPKTSKTAVHSVPGGKPSKSQKPNRDDDTGAQFSPSAGPLVEDIHREVPPPLDLNPDSDGEGITLTDSAPSTPPSSRRESREKEGLLVLPPDES